MQSWFVTVLIAIRDLAVKSEMPALAEEMDIAILVAVNELEDVGRESELDPIDRTESGRQEFSQSGVGPRNPERLH